MAWRQIPYPPDHPPPTSANDPIILERSGLRLELDPLSGDLVALSAPGIGLDLLPGDARITFRLMSHEHLWLERYDRAAWFGIPTALFLACVGLLQDITSEDITRIGALWTKYALIGAVAILWIVAFVDASRCATVREDEELF